MTSSVIYIAGPEATPTEARQQAAAVGAQEPLKIQRRGVTLGWIAQTSRPLLPTMAQARRAWAAGHAVFLPGFVAELLAPQHAHIMQAMSLMAAVLAGEECEDIISAPPYATRIAPQFELLASSYDEGDEQSIVKLDFDVVKDGELVAEDLWLKGAWLSFYEHDSSMRFRCSFGLENYEDVAADFVRQNYAAQLCEAIFPESAIISRNQRLAAFLADMLDVQDIVYVERIIYFNAPEGGAQFHHDAERGHLGVVFANLYGRTGWLALSKQALIDEIQAFLRDPHSEALLSKILPKRKDRQTLRAQAAEREQLAAYLDDRHNDPLEALINHSPEFFARLIHQGYAYVLYPGDVILLPQQSMAHCAWHSVFCLDDFPGHALSFAVRERPREL